MMRNTLRLGDVSTKIGSGATPRGGSDVYIASGVALIRSQNVYNNRFSEEGLVRITEQHANELSNVAVEIDDVLLNITGDSVARCTQVPKSILPARVNQHVAIIRPRRDKLDPGFLRYFLTSPAMQSHMLMLAGAGATRNALTKGMIEDFQVPYFPILQQRRIAEILGALDDKIELNRRMNEMLEAIARAMFEEWMAPPAAAKLPEGWSRSPIKSLTSAIQYGLTQSASQTPVGPKFLRITDIQGGSVTWSRVPFCAVSEVDAEKYAVKDGDIFVARTGASTGENYYAVNPPRSVFASYLVRFQFSDKAIARLVAEFMRSEQYFEFVEGIIGGSAQPNASAQRLAEAEVVVPDEDTRNRFYEATRSLDERRSANDKESETLAELREMHLPKLLSGELRVPTVEKTVAEVV